MARLTPMTRTSGCFCILLMDFTILCDFLETAMHKSVMDIRDALEKMLSYLKDQHPQLVYPVIRLLCCRMDRRRGPYQLGNDRIARIVIETLGMDMKSEQAVKMLKYRMEPMEFTLLIRQAIEERMNNKDAHQSIDEIHSHLDAIATAETAQKREVFLKVLLAFSAKEIFWFVRLLLRDLRLRLSGESILMALSDHASALWNTHTDLQLVVECIVSGQTDRMSLEVGCPFKPMLCKRATHFSLPFVHAKSLIVEEKYDGERILLHKSGTDYKFFTKNYMNESHRYGTIDAGPLTPHIHPQIKAVHCILDGEMMAFKNGRPLPFGALRKLFGYENALTEHYNDEDIRGAQMKYYVFDILYCGDRDLTRIQYMQRKALLTKSIVSNAHIEVVTHQTVDNEEALKACLDQQLQKRKEGIVIKVPTSPYVCGGRGNEWMKIKRSTLNRMNGDFDMVVVGGYFGKRGDGKLTRFLVAVLHDKTEMEMQLVSVCRISSMKREEYKFIQEQFEIFGKRYEPVPWLIHPNSNLPDYLLDPLDCCIVAEVTGHEFIPDDTDYGFSHTIRFPIFTQFRHDKQLEDCEDADELLSTIRGNAMIHSTLSQESSERTRKRKKVAVIDLSDARCTILKGTTFKCDESLAPLIKDMGGAVDDTAFDILVSTDMTGPSTTIHPSLIHQWHAQGQIDTAPEDIAKHTNTSLAQPLQLNNGAFLFCDWKAFFLQAPDCTPSSKVSLIQDILSHPHV